jgi:guanylate kinase
LFKSGENARAACSDEASTLQYGLMATSIRELREQFHALPGRFVVISGPSAGAGKGKVIDEMMAFSDEKLWLSVSTTTREPRPGEVLHHKYTFVTREEFEAQEAAGGFLEANGLTEGARYGTPLAPVLEHMARGEAVMTEIEVNGAEYVQHILPDELYIFIKPTHGDLAEDLAELRRRIEKRGTNDEASIQRRLDQAAGELEQARKLGFYTWVVNETGKSEEAAHAIYDMIASRMRPERV